MTESTRTHSKSDASWDTYWKGTNESNAFSSGGVSHPAIKEFWQTFFSTMKNKYSKPSLVDIASGNGAIIDLALSIIQQTEIKITSVDMSAAAIDNLISRHPFVKGVVSDAANIPLEKNSFDIVTSQFGVEYAGKEALLESAKLTAKGGTLSFVLHIDRGIIFNECQQSASAVKLLLASEFIPLSRELFSAGFATIGGSSRANYEKASKELGPSLVKVENIMREYGKHVAGNTIINLYNDVDKIHQRLQYYKPSDIFNWLDKMNDELKIYIDRMISMTDSALNENEFDDFVKKLKLENFEIDQAAPFKITGKSLPLAWILKARKIS